VLDISALADAADPADADAFDATGHWR